VKSLLHCIPGRIDSQLSETITLSRHMPGYIHKALCSVFDEHVARALATNGIECLTASGPVDASDFQAVLVRDGGIEPSGCARVTRWMPGRPDNGLAVPHVVDCRSMRFARSRPHPFTVSIVHGSDMSTLDRRMLALLLDGLPACIGVLLCLPDYDSLAVANRQRRCGKLLVKYRHCVGAGVKAMIAGDVTLHPTKRLDRTSPGLCVYESLALSRPVLMPAAVNNGLITDRAEGIVFTDISEAVETIARLSGDSRGYREMAANAAVLASRHDASVWINDIESAIDGKKK